MHNGKYIKTENFLTDFADIKELNFVNKHKGTGKFSKRWRSEILDRIPIVAELRKSTDFKGNILEIGAGCCWFSAELSKIPGVDHIHCLDFSDRLLEEIAPLIFRALGARDDKITRVLGDYHKLPFGSGYFDLVVVDAALHHTDYLDLVLKEAHRVLKNNGKIIAIREPIKSLIWPLKKKLGLVDRPVKTYGMIENTYDKKTWTKYFKNADFKLAIRPIYYKGGRKEQLVKLMPLKLFNGILFSRYYFIANKK